MNRVGLALSGGGFRATLYHLGVIRFLRDAQILPRITHITTVSGGSIVGAHLALNWDRYCGSEADFEQAAGEIIRFVQLDVRNRIVRRFPLTSTANTIRRLLRLGGSRKLTRPGLLEWYYERFLYGDKALSQLPDRPRLHILSTNLSEGCLCSFNQGGLLLQRRAPGRRDRFERVHLGLATVPMAVTASSAFPGFFPPLELNAWDVGADAGEFNRQTFTDGGVYDNLGLRMFRWIEQSRVRDTAPLRKDDFLELEDTTAALMSANILPEHAPLRSLREKLALYDPKNLGMSQSEPTESAMDAMVQGLWEIIRSEKLFQDASFQNMELSDPAAQSLVNYVVESGHSPELSDRLWLNRQIIESALRQLIGKPCLRASRGEFDGILVSDAGGKFKVTHRNRAGGLISTALRSSDILMDRVWQLELEAFENTPGVLFLPITEVVDRSQDQLAPHPEIQRQTARIRTDLDRFSELEITALVQHGYCVARKMCRAHTDFFKTEMPTGAPWDPIATEGTENDSAVAPPLRLCEEGQALTTARRLRHSSMRRIWSRLLSFGDWPTYFWIPVLTCLMLIFPYFLYKTTQQSRQKSQVLSAIADTSPLYRKILELLEHGPTTSFPDTENTDVESMQEPLFTGFEIVSDSRIFDLRSWSATGIPTEVFTYVRARVRRTTEGSENTHLRLQSLSVDGKASLICRQQSLNPTFTRMRQADGTYRWELDLDFGHVPIGGDAEVILEGKVFSDTVSQSADAGRFNFAIPVKTGLTRIWVLMPQGRNYDYFELSGYPVGKPELAEIVIPDTKVELPFGSIATFQLINPDANHRYECRWKWQQDSATSYY